jgi:hypothetical protein
MRTRPPGDAPKQWLIGVSQSTTIMRLGGFQGHEPPVVAAVGPQPARSVCGATACSLLQRRSHALYIANLINKSISKSTRTRLAIS